ncbi:MAG: hypothetical protein ACR2LN_07650 [Candidatus Levyibacteriota bacterium]
MNKCEGCPFIKECEGLKVQSSNMIDEISEQVANIAIDAAEANSFAERTFDMAVGPSGKDSAEAQDIAVDALRTALAAGDLSERALGESPAYRDNLKSYIEELTHTVNSTIQECPAGNPQVVRRFGKPIGVRCSNNRISTKVYPLQNQ